MNMRRRGVGNGVGVWGIPASLGCKKLKKGLLTTAWKLYKNTLEELSNDLACPTNEKDELEIRRTG
jgi:hypothetical protein